MIELFEDWARQLFKKIWCPEFIVSICSETATDFLATAERVFLKRIETVNPAEPPDFKTYYFVKIEY